MAERNIAPILTDAERPVARLTYAQLQARMAWLCRLGWAARCPARKQTLAVRVRLLSLHMARYRVALMAV